VTRLLHISASPRGAASASRAIADEFVSAYAQANADHVIEHWDLWDRTLPDFGPAAVAAKMAVFGGEDPTGDAAAAWGRVHEAFARFERADRVLLSVPMWNGGIPSSSSSSSMTSPRSATTRP
jgi:FMN-dependent NADH-azoreductase